MAKSLQEAKRVVRSRLLGRHGVHAVGLRQRDRAVTVYVDAGSAGEIGGLVADLKRELEPYDVVVIAEGRPTIT